MRRKELESINVPLEDWIAETPKGRASRMEHLDQLRAMKGR